MALKYSPSSIMLLDGKGHIVAQVRMLRSLAQVSCLRAVDASHTLSALAPERFKARPAPCAPHPHRTQHPWEP